MTTTNRLLTMLGLAILLSACSMRSNGALTVEGHFDRGRERMRAQDYNGAIADFNKVILFQPKHGGAYFERGRARVARKNLVDALEDFDAAININPTMADAYAERGKVLLEKKEAKAAAEDFIKALELNPNLKPALAPLLKSARELDVPKPD